MIKVKAGNARNSRAIAKFSNAEIDYFGLKLIVHVLIRGSPGSLEIPGEILHTQYRLALFPLQSV